jgi:hypothetical protein
MMSILFAFLLAALFTMVFALGFLRRGTWSSALAFFLILFLSAWAASVWLSSIGPLFLGIYWVPIVSVALLVGALLAGRHAQRERRQVESPAEIERRQRAHELAFDAVFWIAVAGLGIIIVLGYVV